MASESGQAEGLAFESPENLQFERLEPGSGGAPRDLASTRCQWCEQPLVGVYFEVDSKLTCAACRDRAEAGWKSGSGAVRLFKALAAGSGAAVLGALLYYGVRALTGYELSLLSIVVGVLVGKAVRWGSAGRGGRAYQALAVLLTYLAIGGTYLPVFFKEIQKTQAKQAAPPASPAPAAATAVPAGKAAPKPVPSLGDFLLFLGVVVAMAAVLPVAAGIDSPILFLILAIGLYEAWKTSRPAVPHIAGPFTLGA